MNERAKLSYINRSRDMPNMRRKYYIGLFMMPVTIIVVLLFIFRLGLFADINLGYLDSIVAVLIGVAIGSAVGKRRIRLLNEWLAKTEGHDVTLRQTEEPEQADRIYITGYLASMLAPLVISLFLHHVVRLDEPWSGSIAGIPVVGIGVYVVSAYCYFTAWFAKLQ